MLKEKVEFLISQNPYYNSLLGSLPPSNVEDLQEEDSKYRLEEIDNSNFFLRQMKRQEKEKNKDSVELEDGEINQSACVPSRREKNKETSKRSSYNRIYQIMKDNHLKQ